MLRRPSIQTVLLATVIVGCALVVASVSPAQASAGKQISTEYLLGHLTVRTAHYGGYQRSKFRLWTSHPDGCNTRYQVLIRDAVRKPHIGPGCYLTHGKWVSPYDGFTTTNPTKIQIDHVVPLAAAWGAGAWKWNANTRERFANDLGTHYDLLAVSGHANESKGDDGPDQYLPPKKSFDCRYMADYTAVLWRWHLSIDPTDKAFLHNHLAACGWPKVREPKRPVIHDQGTSSTGGGSGSAKGIKITAIYFDSPGSDTGSNTSLNAEWVKITNTSKAKASLDGWVLHDASAHRFAFPAFTLKAKSSVKVHTGSGAETSRNLYWNAGYYVWNNSGDTATLDNAHGTKVNSCTYTSAEDPEVTC